MGALTDARNLLAAACTAAGLETTPYPPDSLAPPAGFVDSISIDLSAGTAFSFCYTGLARAVLTTVAQRNDKAGSTQMLEDLMEPVLEQLEAIDGLRVVGVDSGTANIAGSDLPAVLYQVEFGISSS